MKCHLHKISNLGSFELKRLKFNNFSLQCTILYNFKFKSFIFNKLYIIQIEKVNSWKIVSESQNRYFWVI